MAVPNGRTARSFFDGLKTMKKGFQIPGPSSFDGGVEEISRAGGAVNGDGLVDAGNQHRRIQQRSQGLHGPP